jgi:hypothetical protein
VLGCVPGNIVHQWHGPLSARLPDSAWGVVCEQGLHPSCMKVRDDGLLEWTESASPALRDAVRAYFAGRNEDSRAAALDAAASASASVPSVSAAVSSSGAVESRAASRLPEPSNSPQPKTAMRTPSKAVGTPQEVVGGAATPLYVPSLGTRRDAGPEGSAPGLATATFDPAAFWGSAANSTKNGDQSARQLDSAPSVATDMLADVEGAPEVSSAGDGEPTRDAETRSILQDAAEAAPGDVAANSSEDVTSMQGVA